MCIRFGSTSSSATGFVKYTVLENPLSDKWKNVKFCDSYQIFPLSKTHIQKQLFKKLNNKTNSRDSMFCRWWQSNNSVDHTWCCLSDCCRRNNSSCFLMHKEMFSNKQSGPDFSVIRKSEKIKQYLTNQNYLWQRIKQYSTDQ